MIAHWCKRVVSFVITAFLVFSSALPGISQTVGTGTISGTVTDLSGAIVPSGSITVTNTETGAARDLTTNASGEFTSTFLQPGHYEVVVSAQGFAKVNRHNLVLTVGQVLTVDVSLPPASTTTEVTVTDVSPLIDTLKTQVSQTVSQQMVDDRRPCSMNSPLAARKAATASAVERPRRKVIRAGSTP